MIKKLTSVILAVLCIFTVLTGCGRKEGNKAKSLHIGYFNNITHGQALYMKARDSLTQVLGQETEIQWTSFNAGPAEIEALFSGDIDIGYIGPVPAIVANSRSKGDISVLAGAAKAGSVLVTAPDSGITSLKDIDGKVIAIPQIGNTQHLCLLHLLQAEGFKTVGQGGRVTVAAVENADVENMMNWGHVDAALVPEPWGSVLLKNGACLLLDYDQVYRGGDYPVSVIVVRNDYLKENPALVAAFLKEHERVTALAVEKPQEFMTTVNEEIYAATGKLLEEDVLEGAFGKLQFSTEVSREAMEDFGEITRQESFISESPVNLYTDQALLDKE